MKIFSFKLRIDVKKANNVPLLCLLIYTSYNVLQLH